MKPAMLLLATGTLLAPPAFSHHQFRVAYDFNRLETINGVVDNLELVNPHARLFINVTDDDGQVEQWMVEGPGKLSLARRGWTDDMFTPGESITAVGNPSTEAGRKAIWLDKIVMPDGREFVDPLVADQLAIEEQRRERVRRAQEAQQTNSPD